MIKRQEALTMDKEQFGDDEMILAIASGKGGTGKTTLAVNLALSLDRVQILDCDVEEPNDHLFLACDPKKITDVVKPVPVIDEEKCTGCGECARFCAYNALAAVGKKVLVFPELCHGCGGCRLVCPEGAVSETERVLGTLESDRCGGIHITQGRLRLGEPLATPVVKAVTGQIDNGSDVIIDAPPGTSCPVIEAVGPADFVLLVTEPTPFGLHDLKLAVEVMREIKKPFAVVVNREGSGNDGVDRYCEREGIDIMLKIPQDRKIAELYSRGTPFVEEMPQWKTRFRKLHDRIREVVK